MRRRTVLTGVAGALLCRPAFSQSSRSRTLRLVPQASLGSLDPIWTPASVTTGHGYAIFDTLYALDAQLRPQPQMAEGHTVSDDGLTWTIRLRPALRFHDGEPVRAIDCVASLQRWSKRDAFGQMLAAASVSWDAVDDRTIRIRLARRFSPLLAAIGKHGGVTPFMMPERMARTDPYTQVTEMVGSGPYRFLQDEYLAGTRAAYARFDGYVPREEPSSYMAGGKRAFFDRFETQAIPDEATAAAAILRGEVDWWEYSSPDLNTMLNTSKEVTVSPIDQLGNNSFLQFNCLIPPFSNPQLRHSLLGAFNQADYMAAVAGDTFKWRRCASAFACGLPFATEGGADLLNTPRDLAKVRTAIKAAGYRGERVVIMNPSDFPSVAPLGIITADVLSQVGMNVDLQTMDWGTLVQRRTLKKPVEDGGWSIFHSWFPSASVANPALNVYVRGLGEAGYPGWFSDAEMRRLGEEWTATDTDAGKQAIYDAIERRAWEQAPFVPLGQYFPTAALRSNLQGRVQAALALPWNVRPA